MDISQTATDSHVATTVFATAAATAIAQGNDRDQGKLTQSASTLFRINLNLVHRLGAIIHGMSLKIIAIKRLINGLKMSVVSQLFPSILKVSGQSVCENCRQICLNLHLCQCRVTFPWPKHHLFPVETNF